MNRRSRTLQRSGKPRTESFNRYLKPGTLAQIRNSRMIARLNRIKSISQIQSSRLSLSPPSASMDSGVIPVNLMEELTCFNGRVFGPVFPQRKKLLPVKSSWFITPSPTETSADLPPNQTMDVLGSDIIAAR